MITRRSEKVSPENRADVLRTVERAQRRPFAAAARVKMNAPRCSNAAVHLTRLMPMQLLCRLTPSRAERSWASIIWLSSSLSS